MAYVSEQVRADLPIHSILEVGSQDINGTVRPLLTERFPEARYVGTDFAGGKGVDVVCNAVDLANYFAPADLVISTEMMEHVEDWRGVTTALKAVTQKYLLITTRSVPYGYHGYPHDYWRYSLEDMQNIFADFLIRDLTTDPQVPGVFMFAEKVGEPTVDLSQIKLYKMEQP